MQSLQQEPILIDNKDRFVLFPIKNIEMWEYYKKIERKFWAPNCQLDLGIEDYKKSTVQEQELLKFANTIMVLRFKNEIDILTSSLLHEVQYAEARCFIGYQNMMSKIHMEVYSLFDLDCLDRNETKELITKITNSDSFKRKEQWVNNNFTNQKDFSKKLIASCIIQRLFYSSIFMSILSFKKQDTMKMLTMLTDFVYEDEGLFTDFALSIYSQLKNKISFIEVNAMVLEGLEIEKSMINEFAEYYTNRGIKVEKLIEYSNYITCEILNSLSSGQIPIKVNNPFKCIKWERHYVPIDPNRDYLKEQKEFRTLAFDADF